MITMFEAYCKFYNTLFRVKNVHLVNVTISMLCIALFISDETFDTYILYKKFLKFFFEIVRNV